MFPLKNLAHKGLNHTKTKVYADCTKEEVFYQCQFCHMDGIINEVVSSPSDE